MSFKSLWVMSVLVFSGSFAIAQVASPTPATSIVPDQSLDALIPSIVSAFSSGKLAMGIAGIVVCLTYLFRKFFVDEGKVGAGSLPWVSTLLAVLFGVGSNVLLGASPASAASAILLSGPLAGHLWASIIKLVLHKDA